MDRKLPQNTLNQAGQQKDVLPDSSSLILLQFSGIVEITCCHYNVLVTPSVYQEIAEVDKPGAAHFTTLHDQQIFEVIKEPDDYLPASLHNVLQKMGNGERQVLAHILAGCGDFVVVDDLQAVKFCVRHKIPFINSLLIPRILLFAGLISTERADESYSLIKERGRYSNAIIQRAGDFQESDLIYFFP